MDCYKARRLLAARCGAGFPPGERDAIESHVAHCRSCAALSRQYLRGREALRSLPVLTPPADLVTSLRVLASHERERRLSGERMPVPLARWIVRVRLWAGAMMRPLALPFAGGLASAVILFALVVPSIFAPQAASAAADVPTMLSTEAAFVGVGPYGIGEDNITVDMTLDSRGRFVDYSIPGGQDWVKDPDMRRNVENTLLFLRFSPGTTFGMPASSTIRITLRRSQIDVRG